jgi:hypothetical protein
MSHEITVLTRKNSREVIRVITNHYKKCSFFLACLCYCELWQHFSSVLNYYIHLKNKMSPTSSIGTEYTKSSIPSQEEVARKFSGLEEHPRTLHHTLHNICIFTIRK